MAQVTLNLEVGHALATLVTAYLSQGCPSALIHRVMMGIEEYQLSMAGKIPDSDLAIVRELHRVLAIKYTEFRNLETETYSKP